MIRVQASDFLSLIFLLTDCCSQKFEVVKTVIQRYIIRDLINFRFRYYKKCASKAVVEKAHQEVPRTIQFSEQEEYELDD